MQRLVTASVHQLQQLHGELHIPQPAAAEFELAAAHVGGNQLLHAPPHGLHLGHEIVTLAGDPDHGRSARPGSARRARASPTADRAFISAWNSQVLAQRW